MLHIFEREGEEVYLPAAVFGNDGTGFLAKQVKVDALGLSFAFGNDKLSVCLIDGNEVYLIGVTVSIIAEIILQRALQ